MKRKSHLQEFAEKTQVLAADRTVFIEFTTDGTHTLKLEFRSKGILNTCLTTYALKFCKFNPTLLEDNVMISEINK